MCYEESFFRSWARKRAERREKVDTVMERRTPAPPQQPAPKPAAEPAKRKETERELEIV